MFAVVLMTRTASNQDSGELHAPAVLLLVQVLELLGLELEVLLLQCVHDLVLMDKPQVLHYGVRLLGLQALQRHCLENGKRCSAAQRPSTPSQDYR